MLCHNGLLLIVTVALLVLPCPRARSAEPLQTVVDLCRAYPERVQSLFANLDLAGPGLEETRAAAERADWPAACEALLAYYRSVRLPEWRRLPHYRDALDKWVDADQAMDGVFVFSGDSAKVPERSGGGWDWTYLGPRGDREWGWCMNRHYHLRKAFQDFQRTGREDYLRFINANLQDWLVALPPYPAESSSTPQWRGLEVGIRLSVWSELFYGLLEQPEIAAPTWVLLLGTIPDHAHYLEHFHTAGNWLICEMRGLAECGTSWPEFRDSAAWRDLAFSTLAEQMAFQVYPDGAQIELTSGYHLWVTQEFQAVADLAGAAGYRLPEAYRQSLERMWDYLVYTSRPDRTPPLNNDAELVDLAPYILPLVPAYGRSDWAWILTGGREGRKPRGLPSRFYPWAGQAIMRSGWGRDDAWTFFDVGPLGFGGHSHPDMLHLSIYAGGRDLLVDSGIGNYMWKQPRPFFMSTAAHNVMLVDGHGQKRSEPRSDAPISGTWAMTPRYDFARGVCDKGFDGVDDPVTHLRAVAWLHGRYWVIVDRVECAAPHTLEFLWHFHPKCTVAVEGSTVCSVDDGQANLRITPVPGRDLEVHVVKGQMEPEVQGWYSPAYNVVEPNPTIVYTARVEGPCVFAWVLNTARGPVPGVSAALSGVTDGDVTIRVRAGSRGAQTVTIPFTGPPVLGNGR